MFNLLLPSTPGIFRQSRGTYQADHTTPPTTTSDTTPNKDGPTDTLILQV